MRVLSLGWGVQSFTLAAMSALGEIERADVALHADTTHEQQGTYKFAVKYTPWLEMRGVKIVTVTDTRPELRIMDEWGGAFIPAYTRDETGKVWGTLRRQCTGGWKIAPMRRWLQANRNRQPIEQWIGISLDEALRMKPSDVKYITNRWPLIERRMTRADCVRWLQSHGLDIPTKSACVFCPYHSKREWQDLKHHGGSDWQKAIEVDNAIRKARPPYDLFIHPARIPLEKVDLRTQEEKGQLRLEGWDAECSGLCGV